MNKNYTLVLMCVMLLGSFGLKAQNAQKIVDTYLSENYATYKLNAQDVSDVRIKTSAFNKKSSLTHAYVEQFVNELPVFEGLASITIKDGEVIYVGNRMQNNLSQKVNTATPGLSPQAAIVNAASTLGLSVQGISLKEELSPNTFVFNGGEASQNDINVRLGYARLDSGALHLAYELDLHYRNGKHWYSVKVDAISGSIIAKNDWVLNCTFESHEHNNVKATQPLRSVLEKDTAPSILVGGGSYNVYALPLESPDEGERSIITDPATEDASPFGWHDTDGDDGAEFTITRGNNVWAFEDIDGASNFGESPEGGDDLEFDYDIDFDEDALVYTEAATTNLFYWSNIIHDILYEYGFDEASGNFQATNYSGDGLEGDGIFALAQDGSRINNAQFSSPVDGSNGVMRMFLWNTLPENGNLQITEPASLAGDIPFSAASFGSVFPSPEQESESFELALAFDADTTGDDLDACDPISNPSDLVGKIAVVRRGSCNFTDKVAAAQNAGAEGVVVVNNVPDDIFNLAGTNNLINIPSGMINQEDGEALIAALRAGDTVVAVPTRPNFKDGSFDNGIIAHEYGHGLSIRLTAGAGNSNCLGNQEQMGEGWSDYVGLMLTMKEGDLGTDARGIGTYATNQGLGGLGIRPRPYSTDMAINDFTYDQIKEYAGDGVPHPTGHLWATMLWEMTWGFIDRYGFDEDIYKGTGGNNIALNLVVDGLKFQPCNPGFVDGRDAILAAISAADYIPNKQVARCIVWETFAKRGLGINADQANSDNRSDGTEDFSVPEEFEGGCANLSTEDFSGTSFAVFPNPTNGEVNVKIDGSFGEGQAQIFDINGREVFSKGITLEGTVNMNAPGLASGVYILKLSNASTSYTTKLIVK